MKEFVKNFTIAALGVVTLFLVIQMPEKETETINGSHPTPYKLEFYEQAYKGVSEEKLVTKAIFVNHHMLFPNFVAQQLNAIRSEEELTVILISPNHFYAGNGGVIASKYSWQTPYGDLNPNLSLISKLETLGLLNVVEEPFKTEHGINSIVSFIKKSIPNATVVPLIIKDNANKEQLVNLSSELSKIIVGDAVMIGSFDFSHYLPSNAADFHDLQTISTIRNFDFERIEKLDIDSKGGMRLFLQTLNLIGHNKFVITNHSNTSKGTGNYNYIETTSYINGYFTSGAIEPDNNTTVLYHQGLDQFFNSDRFNDKRSPEYAFTKSERLFEFNDVITNTMPGEIKFLDLQDYPIAVGLVKRAELVKEVYLFPIEIDKNQVKLLTKVKADTILANIATSSKVDQDIKNQIKTGHVIIK
ncbi:MAG: AmmeMemoRadiSam system protein B [Candidatus Doudnabacteria bacterium RIFCSPLOWO2_02_FULL_42_9]|uniref:AmmeMemoRadiSam system protein B n=1 Tax=Candidatus Doudnabacteria bacterium RIFCSPHIGHO2_01_FULL_41_86 TaxID=1817821 RepID=A0A1F5N899_9BACT|nr:MAG: AmmeMemoRadiSam system protein B [Candidatus Doudnabacteria bacterium RIFCSPHIGHO2_01_FULL_41_86]OGE75884.1 MAG: AmmeMemoRadiSam system protein B [Candidatus Doudnabacteria bacterium RIFCSPHIGHO2_01_43_10]OGE86258.1 MAG: AmmeMemoRadiSam system protein B [Candidatus Doudnabacteria bacterium RIFCSPHIGHO2_12_FULL_42_22]OGE87106.1 MAG: AmmeMemoRadiSam system protein B [Candidatus Doudnabacteria bacterium RIFCSPHIGHO2_02_FULL_42_25]OGE92246.1 MAG: AmmeMemoRadiSam system protein B [Candidatus